MVQRSEAFAVRLQCGMLLRAQVRDRSAAAPAMSSATMLLRLRRVLTQTAAAVA